MSETHTDNSQPTRPGAPKGFFARGMQWPMLVVAILASSVIAHVIIIAKISNDPTFAVQEDYYEDAVNWDQRKELERASEALGWKVDASATSLRQAGAGKLRVDLDVRDEEGRAIDDADVWVEAFAVARSGRVMSAAMSSASGGYQTEFDGGRPGLWELDLDIRRGDDRWVRKMRVNAVPQ